MGKNQHVTPHPDGGWQVKGAGNSRATVRTATQKEAIDIAREISRNQGSELVIHRPNGQIRAPMDGIRSRPKANYSEGGVHYACPLILSMKNRRYK